MKTVAESLQLYNLDDGQVQKPILRIIKEVAGITAMRVLP